ncbi:hypothetical protein NM688_g422 [Phlebia brevispora]|uniref:Uncharacterized protein n=1 Tax=Phlebia brevispora TaxID=194682 RepID=A0ACC1TE23_9APHY|nr:hypothetical protein NM688_g422 [Phlebia brevispora]
MGKHKHHRSFGIAGIISHRSPSSNLPHKAAKRSAVWMNTSDDEQDSLPKPTVAAKGRDVLLKEIQENEVTVLVGETGSGKTTQVPQYLLESGIAGSGTIAVTQPRRVAATSLAARVATEKHVAVGSLVGYSVRFDESWSDKTRIKYVTDGMLVRELLSDSLLSKYSVIIVDEAHERTLRTDILMANLKTILKKRNQPTDRKGKGRAAALNPLKLIIMSATLDAEKFSSFYDNAKILYVRGRQHAVKIYHSITSQADYVDAALRTFFQIHTDQPPGDVLVFLPGQEDIESLAKSIELYTDRLPPQCPGVTVCPLYAALPPSRQAKIFQPTPKGTRKCILATNIAETSITIPGVKYVIDTGKCKEKRHVARTVGAGFDTLLTRDITKSSAMQRAGRAGREGPGYCFRLYTEESFKAMPMAAEPEIRRCTLTSSLLQLKCLGQDIETLEFMDKPDPESIQSALATLYLLSALDDRKILTKTGKRMAFFPLEPIFARALLAADEYGCLLETIDVVSVLSSSSKLFVDTSDERENALEAHRKFRHSSGDHLTILNVVRAYDEISASESKAGRKAWCQKQYINFRCLTEAMDIRKQLREVCEKVKIDWRTSCGDNEQPLLKSLVCGLVQNAAFLQPDGSYKQVMGPSVVKIHPGSALCDKKVPAIIYDELNRSRNYQQYNNNTSPAMSVDAVHDARRLLAAYPLASATPSTHVSRHLSNLSLTATPPSYYVQPAMYSIQYAPVPQTYSQYGEYGPELSHLSSRSVPYNDGGYWERTRNDAVRYIGEQPSTYASNFSQWENQPSTSSYQSNAFAQSVFQQVTPSASYPTPPPPGIKSSSSSLAFALGDPAPRAAPRVYSPAESSRFFDDFLAKQANDLNASTSRSVQQDTTPRRRSKQKEDSPDPLAFTPATPQTSRKRKAVQSLESPTLKRTHSGSSVVPPQQNKNVRSPSAPRDIKDTVTPRRKLMPFVELPPIPKIYQTPASQKSDRLSSYTPSERGKGKKREYDDDDLGGFGSEEDELPTRHVTSSVRRATGDRDARAPLDKLDTLFEDILEAEDTLPPDADLADLSYEFFSPLTTDSSHPLLHPNVIKKLTTYVSKVARPGKRSRQTTRDSTRTTSGTPKAKVSLRDLDTATLGRIFRLLERSVKAGEDLDPFSTLHHVDSQPRSPSKKSTKKSATKDKQRSKSKTPLTADNDEAPTADRGSPSPEGPADADLDALMHALQVARDSVQAADCCIMLLSSDKLTKQLYSEELITACLSAVKNQLTRIVYPFVEACADMYGQVPSLLRHIVQPSAAGCGDLRRCISDIFHAVTSAIPRINELVCADAMSMSEGIIIQAVYIAIGPFFVADGAVDSRGKEKKDSMITSALGSSAMRGLRLDALSLIRSIFANHEDQRNWIIEEILSSLIKLSDSKQKAGQFRLRDGRSIRTVSALLLQLVQTSAHDVRVEARAIRKARQHALALHQQGNTNDSSEEPFLDERDMEVGSAAQLRVNAHRCFQELRLYTTGLESATKAAKTIIGFLTQRSGKTKATKNSNEAEYRAIFDNLIADLLTVLYWPDWPAASILLNVAIRFMISSLDDVKSSAQTENNGAKNMALDHLGVIAARLRSNAIRHGQDANPLKALDEVSSILDLAGLEMLVNAYQDIFSYLSKRSEEDQAYSGARELTTVIWGQELSATLKQTSNLLEEECEEGSTKPDKKARLFGMRLKEALSSIWKDCASDVFDSSSQEETTRADQLCEELGNIQILRAIFNPILNVILQALDAPPVFMRTKALRALGQIVTSDPSILVAANVRRSIETHLLDSSAAVRDAAVELIGKYMIDSPAFASDYYQRIADRIADTGLGVRKRVIKLLKLFYGVTEERERKIDICVRMVLRMLDEDDTVRDAAVKTMEELWFPDMSASSQRPPNDLDKSLLTAKVSVIMGVAAHFKDRQSPLEDLLHKAMAEKEASGSVVLHLRYSEICETLIDGLVDASDLPGFTVVNCVRTIYLFTSAYPAVLSVQQASTLLPYLKNASTPEEQATSDYLLRIFRASLPHLPKTALKFGQELQAALQPMILKPSGPAGVMGLQETVACMCTVVQHVTHEHNKLVALLRSCSSRLLQALNKPVSSKAANSEVRTLSILILIAALLCEYCDFEALRAQDDVRQDLDAITKMPVTTHMYNTFLRLYDKYSDSHLRSRILQCLGFLFRAQPSLLTAETSAHIMDGIFNSDDEEGRSAQQKTAATDVDMDELVGNTDQFADSGVSSAVVQRYLHFILQAALSRNQHMQAAAVDILSFTIKQGLAHPLQCFPIIVALETSSNTSLSTRASGLHAILHSKHMSLLNARFLPSARASFNYQKTIADGPVQGYRLNPEPIALLHHWYTLVREKRPTRQEFLKALVKVFDIEVTKTTQDDINFARYMAENFASFDYKTQEEVLTVLKYLTSVLSTTGSQIVELLSPSHLLTQLHEGASVIPQEAAPDVEMNSREDEQSRVIATRSSVAVSVVMLLKAYLKNLYNITNVLSGSLGKKTALGDRAAVRRHQNPLTWDRMSYAFAPLLTTEDFTLQREQFLAIWSEDGCTAEPEDDIIA